MNRAFLAKCGFVRLHKVLWPRPTSTHLTRCFEDELQAGGRWQKERLVASAPRLALSCSSSTSQSSGQSGVQAGNTVDIAVEGGFTDVRGTNRIAAELEDDAQKLLCQVKLPQSEAAAAELSIVLCDDPHISELNLEYRDKSGPTDVLSFAMDSPPGYPLQALGDVVISLDTAQRQADERGHTLRDECRILLTHGLLHLCGLDHERGEAETTAMAEEEQRILSTLGWQGSGLIAAADVESDLHSGGRIESEPSTSVPVPSEPVPSRTKPRGSSDIRLLALDMDGTLLDSRSKVLPSSVEALKAALAAGVRVCLATGKARPAAIAAMARNGLAGDGLVVSSRGPGLFLQGLAVHGKDGSLLEGPDLPQNVVRAAFKYAQDEQVALAAFLGDDCVTLQMHPELEELHYRYYEPLCEELESLDALLAGPPVKKLLYMASSEAIAERHQPHWVSAVQGLGAETMMAVPNMLELVPRGVNKWEGMQLLLRDLGLSSAQLMSCGDGANDLQLVAASGLGVAMGNAVPQVKEAAAVVVADNDGGGVAEAIEKFLL